MNSRLLCLLMPMAASFSPWALAASLQLAAPDITVKVRPSSALKASDAPPLQLLALKGETESAQLALWSQHPLQLKVNLSPLLHPNGQRFPPEALQLRLAHPVRVERPSSSQGASGEWPDPLIPLTQSIRLSPNRTQALWLTAQVPRNIPAGRYTGTLQLQGLGGIERSLPIHLDVAPLTLPQMPSLPLLVGIDFEALAQYEGTPKTPADTRALLRPYYRLLRQNGAFPLFVHGAQPGYRDNGQQVFLDMAPFWQALEDALEDQLQNAPISIPFSETWPIDTRLYPFGTTEFRTRALRYLRAMAQALEQRQGLAHSFIYIAATDEPKTAAQMQLTRQVANLLQEAHPQLQLLQTAHAHCEDCTQGSLIQQDHPSFMWAPNIAYYNNQAMRAPGFFSQAKAMPSGWTAATTQQLKRQKRPLWWYLNPWTFLLKDTPAYPNLFIDHSGLEQRITGWLAFKESISGIGHWNATYWHSGKNPWQALPHGEKNAGIAGDGALIYPSAGAQDATGQAKPQGPVSSIRLELLRDGAEDFALLHMAQQKNPAQVQALLQPLLQSLTQYSQNPHHYHQARLALVQLLSAPTEGATP